MKKEIKNRRLEIRLKNSDYELLKATCYALGITPSKMLRMLIDSTLKGIKYQLDKEDTTVEDIKTFCNNQL